MADQGNPEIERVFAQSLSDMIEKDVPFFLRSRIRPHTLAIAKNLEAALQKAGYKVVKVEPKL